MPHLISLTKEHNLYMIEHYELVYLLNVATSPEDAKKIHDAVAQQITSNGTITKSGEIGKRKLAYEINHETHAVYWLVQFDAETESVKELHRILTLNQSIIRFLIVSVKPKTQEDIEREERMKESLEKERMKEKHEEREKVEVETKKKEKEIEATKKEEPKEKLSLEELDKKLDELLDDETINT